jgi:hypothetical protein
LGFVNDHKGVLLDASKVQSLAQWSTPQSEPTHKKFFGGINVYRKSIPHFSHLVNPFHHLANQSTFIWNLAT